MTRPITVLFYLAELENKTLTGNDIKNALKKARVIT
jgi:hypothetical protein